MNTQQEEAREYLLQVKDMKKKTRRLSAEIRSIRESAMSIESPLLTEDRVQTSHGMDPPCIRKTDRMIDMESRLIEEYRRLQAVQSDIAARINSMDVSQERTVLRFRYLSGWNWDDIANALGVSLRTAHRIHEAALLHFPTSS